MSIVHSVLVSGCWSIPADLPGLRDHTLLIVGFAGTLRRVEIAIIKVERLSPTERGQVLTLPQTKVSQAAAVRT
ncbi:hypothetical protein ACFHPP_31445, partial [Falsiroseomonas sp. E2-1-a20]